jgi:hypothetical protein
LARRNDGLTQAPHPDDRRADACAELRRRLRWRDSPAEHPPETMSACATSSTAPAMALSNAIGMLERC